MKIIEKMKLRNFRRFDDFEVPFAADLNLLIGDNEAGKSSILLALELVLSGSRGKVEGIGLESLFNQEAIIAFLKGPRTMDRLPVLFVEVYLNSQNDPDLNGKQNSDGKICDGLKLICEPMDELSKEINEIITQKTEIFPFEYYSIKFLTFGESAYTGYRKIINHLFIDSTQINSEYATKEYIRALYYSHAETKERYKNQNEYRKHKENFKQGVLRDLNNQIEEYQFTVRTSQKANLETDLTIEENGITIENCGEGKQCFIKTEFALSKKSPKKPIDVLLIEEPENHLSHGNMKKLIRIFNKSQKKQLFIATHNSLICTRLDLRKAIFLNSASNKRVLLTELNDETARFFMKAPDNNVLEFILSRKVILVEGDAEFILMEAFYKSITNENFEDSNIHVISVGGTCFKRYLEIAKLLKIKTAVIKDNDGDYQGNCVDRFSEFDTDNIKIFSDPGNNRSTFEICLYQDNTKICDDLFGEKRKSLSVQDFMLKNYNKADVAFELLDKKGDKILPPQYIKDAVCWIKK